ncbi:hypothetical protein K1719_040174 [Acacia pycnantha]|nr:hypothetical protein K1719_040174 [Acacia pycnantha]
MHLTPSCMLHLARGDIAQLVELRSCNWVVAITGWMSNCPGVGHPCGFTRKMSPLRNSFPEDYSDFYTSFFRTKQSTEERSTDRIRTFTLLEFPQDLLSILRPSTKHFRYRSSLFLVAPVWKDRSDQN